MAWNRPTLTDLRSLSRSFFASRLPGADVTLRRSVIAVASDVIAGVANGLYGYLDYLIRQAFASLADFNYLQVIGAEYGLFPTGPAQAAGSATFTGNDGAPISLPLLLQDNLGNQYSLQAAGTPSGGSVTLAVEAVLGGSAENLPIGAPLALVSAVAGINSTAKVADDGTGNGLTGGLDAETVENFRSRVMARKQKPPQGGTNPDYIEWAKVIAGVTRVWTYPLNRGGGTIDVTFVMDARTSIIPLSGDVTTVQAAIDANRPVTDSCVVFAPTSLAVNFTIHGSFTADVQASITAALKDLFSVDAIPGGALNPDTGGTFSGGLSFQDQIDPAVASGAGSTPFNITVPSGDVAGASGRILVLGTITFTP